MTSNPKSPNKQVKESYRGDVHAEKYSTGIFKEVAEPDNPYCSQSMHCYGYNQLDLLEHLDFSQYLFLLLRGRLPETHESQLLNRALIAFSNPGVRHPATRAAVTAGVGKTVSTSVLPAALIVMSGERDGAGSIERAMRYLRKACRQPLELAPEHSGVEWVCGLYAGSPSHYLDAVCERLIGSGEYPALQWGRNYIQQQRTNGVQTGWLQTGLLAATFTDLGVLPRLAPGALQLLAAPGLLAQGMENAHRATSVMPFLSDDKCEIERPQS